LINATDDNQKHIHFDDNYEFLINALASQAAIAIENARLTKELQNAQLDTIFRLSMATEIRESGDPLHICRISEYSVAIAEGLTLPDSDIELIRESVPLHDIGKMGISDHILQREDALSIEEQKLLEQHVPIGAKILENPQSKVLKMARSIVLSHHENYDGSGYPRGLKKDEIPIEGRIVALADSIDSMTSRYEYYQKSTFTECSNEILKQSGKYFDPVVVKSFKNQHERIKLIHETWRLNPETRADQEWEIVYRWWKTQVKK